MFSSSPCFRTSAGQDPAESPAGPRHLGHERIQSKDNKKHIEIVLLDKAEIIVKAGINAQKQFAKDVLSGLTEEEKHMCIDVFDKICNNAEKYIKEYKEQN